jgi:branched-chain amino acid transport system ATP-binding protein
MLLELRDVYVHYERAVAVQGVSIKVNEGDLVAILGANGAGKTSVLRAISGLKEISRGEILFQGEKIDGMKAAHISRLGIAHCPQGRNLFPYMTVYENLYLGAYHMRSRVKIEEGLDNVQKMFPVLKERARQLAGTLSGGEQQMLAIGRTLISGPKLLLLDEPSLGLSPILVDEISNLIRNEIRGSGIAMILVEQNTSVALDVATRVYLMANGEIVMEGDPSEVLKDTGVIEAYVGKA